jgi:hypothetical protein
MVLPVRTNLDVLVRGWTECMARAVQLLVPMVETCMVN